jgi:predicted RNA-binding Zn-ribbon protein involved in translation (DUF1610 family)
MTTCPDCGRSLRLAEDDGVEILDEYGFSLDAELFQFCPDCGTVCRLDGRRLDLRILKEAA